MIKASNKFIQSINDGNARYIARGNITLADGTALVIDNSKIWESGIKIEDSVSSSSSDFTIGAFVSTKLTLTLNNITDEYSSYDFNKAEIKALGIGLDIDGTEEIYSQGQFWVDEPKYNGSLISLTCSDRARFFNKQFVAPTFPISLGGLLEYCVVQCLGSNTYLATSTFNNSTYMIQTEPKVDNWTYADAVACIAQIAGSYAKFDKDGKLYIDWYGIDSSESKLDGGTFNTQTTPYSDGDEADGGDYTFSDNVVYDGGTFKEMDNFHVVYSLKSMNLATDNCTITKIEVTEVTANQSDAGSGSYSLSQKIGSTDTSKDDNYVIKITNNRLIEKGQSSIAAKLIGDLIVGITFRPMTITSIYNPLIEAGDVAYVVDKKGKSYFAFVSSRSSTIGSETSFTCSGKPESKQNQISYSDLSKAMAQIKDNFEYVKTAYQTAQENLMQIIAFAGGLYKTEIKQADGSVIRYEHDKPLLADSKKVWKYTADACAVTTAYTGNDLTTVWNSGVEASGDALFRHITAESITGFILTGNKINNGNGTFSVDESGNLIANSAKIKGEINATSGSITGNMNVTGTLNGGTIKGAEILGGTFRSLVRTGDMNENKIGIYIGDGGVDICTPAKTDETAFLHYRFSSSGLEIILWTDESGYQIAYKITADIWSMGGTPNLSETFGGNTLDILTTGTKAYGGSTIGEVHYVKATDGTQLAAVNGRILSGYSPSGTILG